jgi:hypothetical protein
MCLRPISITRLLKASGSYADIMNSGIDVEQYIGTKNETSKDSIATVKKEEKIGTADKVQTAESKTEEKKGGELMTKEERKEGDTSMDTYITFVKYGGYVAFLAVVMFQLGTQVYRNWHNFTRTEHDTQLDP